MDFSEIHIYNWYELVNPCAS